MSIANNQEIINIVKNAVYEAFKDATQEQIQELLDAGYYTSLELAGLLVNDTSKAA